MDFPELREGQHAVLAVEVQTGIVLSLDGKRWRRDQPAQRWRVFDSFAAAREFAVAEIAAHPAFECTIFKAQNQHVQTVRNEEHVAALLAASRARRKI